MINIAFTTADFLDLYKMLEDYNKSKSIRTATDIADFLYPILHPDVMMEGEFEQ